jgi:hypothetical protein
LSISLQYKQAYLALSKSELQAIKDELPEVIDDGIEEAYEKFLAE